jgi:hypothetical protein
LWNQTGNHPFSKRRKSSLNINIFLSKVWGVLHTATKDLLLYVAQPGNKLRCRITSKESCTSPSTVESNTLVMNITTGINSVPADYYGIRYYPNPVKNFLFVDGLKLIDQWNECRALAFDGRTLSAFNTKAKTNLSIPVAHFPSGYYTVLLKNSKGKKFSFYIYSLVIPYHCLHEKCDELTSKAPF